MKITGRRAIFYPVLFGLLISVPAFTVIQYTAISSVPEYTPRVFAGQVFRYPCSGGFYARLDQTIVLTTAGHCGGKPGDIVSDEDGKVLGTWGSREPVAACATNKVTCSASDMDYIVLVPEQVPWGYLNMVQMNRVGYRTIAPGTRPLACDDIAIGDPMDVSGHLPFRTGTILEKRVTPREGTTSYQCLIAADVHVIVGDSGGPVFVRDLPAGTMSASFGGTLGFNALAPQLAWLGLDLCTTPDCDLR